MLRTVDGSANRLVRFHHGFIHHTLVATTPHRSGLFGPIRISLLQATQRLNLGMQSRLGGDPSFCAHTTTLILSQSCAIITLSPPTPPAVSVKSRGSKILFRYPIVGHQSLPYSKIICCALATSAVSAQHHLTVKGYLVLPRPFLAVAPFVC